MRRTSQPIINHAWEVLVSIPQLLLKQYMAVIIFGLTFTIYLISLSPTINSFDSAELITGAFSLGIVHAPGYPLYLLISHYFMQLPFGTIPFKVNLLSALFTSFATVNIFFISKRVSGFIASSFVVSLLFAFSRLVWGQAVLAEVYALNAFLISGVVLAALNWYENPVKLRFYVLAFLFGLSLTNHPSAMLVGPLIVWIIIKKSGEVIFNNWRWIGAIAVAGLPLLLYLYLPIRFLADPPLNYVGNYFEVNLASFQGVLWMVTGRMFATEVFGRGLADGLHQLVFLGKEIWLNLLGGGLILAFYGFLRLWDKKKDFAIFFFGGALLQLFFFSFYNVVDNAKMLTPTLLLLTPLVAAGLGEFSRTMVNRLSIEKKTFFAIRVLVAVGIVGLMVPINWQFASRRNDWSAYNFAHEVLLNVEPSSLILAQWTTVTPLLYVQIVEGARPDVEIIDKGLIVLGIRDKLLQSGNNSEEDIRDEAVAAILGMVDAALPNRAVYLMEDDPVIRAHYCLELMGNGYFRVQSKQNEDGECVAP